MGILQPIITIVLFFLILGTLVVIHEIGHFVAARLAGLFDAISREDAGVVDAYFGRASSAAFQWYSIGVSENGASSPTTGMIWRPTSSSITGRTRNCNS